MIIRLSVAKYVTLSLLICAACYGGLLLFVGYSETGIYWFFLAAGKDGTVFAPGYTEERFNQIKVGMNRGEVTNILNEPLERVVNECSGKFVYILYPDSSTEVMIDRRTNDERARLCQREESWRYTRYSGVKQNYLVRNINFSPSGEVSSKGVGYWVD